MRPFATSSRLASWIGIKLLNLAGDFDKERRRSSVTFGVPHYWGQAAYPLIHSIIKAEAPKNGGIPTHVVDGRSALLPRKELDHTQQGMDDPRVRPFTRQAGREANACAQYAIGSSLLVKDPSAAVSAISYRYQ